MEFVEVNKRGIALRGYVRISYNPHKKNKRVPTALIDIISNFMGNTTDFSTKIDCLSMTKFNEKYEEAIYFDRNDIKFDIEIMTDIEMQYYQFFLSLNCSTSKYIKFLFIKYEMICKETNTIYKSVKLLSSDHIYDKASWPGYILPISKLQKVEGEQFEFICNVQLLRIVYTNSLNAIDAISMHQHPQNSFCKIKRKQTINWIIDIDNDCMNDESQYFNLYYSDCQNHSDNIKGWDILFVYDAMKKRKKYPISLELQLVSCPNLVKAMYVRASVSCNDDEYNPSHCSYISYRNNFINLWELQKISNVCLSFTVTIEILQARDYYYNLIPQSQWKEYDII